MDGRREYLPGQRARRAEALRNRVLRRWLARRARAVAGAVRLCLARLGAEAELRALDERELRDLGLDQGGLAYAARHGRDEAHP